MTMLLAVIPMGSAEISSRLNLQSWICNRIAAAGSEASQQNNGESSMANTAIKID